MSSAVRNPRPLTFGTIREINGRTCVWTPVYDYILPEYYSHGGPGWDYRAVLLEPGFCMERYGFEPTDDQVWSHPNTLPKLVVGEWSEVQDNS
ncbi:MAG: hypothetical protein PVI21_03665 [Candidatus Woesebacteria bacterium]